MHEHRSTTRPDPAPPLDPAGQARRGGRCDGRYRRRRGPRAGRRRRPHRHPGRASADALRAPVPGRRPRRRAVRLHPARPAPAGRPGRPRPPAAPLGRPRGRRPRDPAPAPRLGPLPRHTPERLRNGPGPGGLGGPGGPGEGNGS
ncbi:hypothetical protein LT493_06880 [Streptomyces tricolor]|nr:hypothetical protein [Streptomyces tricolor]